MSRRPERVVALSIAGLALIGLVDAAVVREPDLVVLFAGIVFAGIVVLRAAASRPRRGTKGPVVPRRLHTHLSPPNENGG